MKDKVKLMLEEYGLTESQLTREELLQLEEEIKAKEDGYLVLDGVFSNPELLYCRKYKLPQNDVNGVRKANKPDEE